MNNNYHNNILIEEIVIKYYESINIISISIISIISHSTKYNMT